MKIKTHFSKNKKEISLIWIFVGGIFGMGIYMGAFEGELFKNGGDIVKDLGNSWNLLGIVNKGPVEKREVDKDDGAVFTDNEKKVAGKVEIGGIENIKGVNHKIIWEADYKLDETGSRFEEKSFKEILEEEFKNGRKVELDRKRVIKTSENLKGIKEENGKLSGKEDVNKSQDICGEKEFKATAFIDKGLVEKKEDELKKRRNVFCNKKDNRVEKYLRNKLLEERMTSAVFNGLDQARILMTGNHIYVKFKDFGIYVGRAYFKKGNEKKGGKLSFETLKKLEVDGDKEKELRTDWENIKTRNIELKKNLMELEILEDEETGKILKIESRYDNGLDTVKEAQKKVSEKIGTSKSSYKNVEDKLSEYKDTFKKKGNERKELEKGKTRDKFVGKTIDLRDARFAQIEENMATGGGVC